MKINLSPVRRDDSLELSVTGAVVTVNGEPFDFSQMADGDTLPASAISSQWFVGDVHKTDGELELTLILPLPTNYSPAQAFPAPLLVTADGAVALPPPLPLTDPDPEAIEEPQA
ncbi:hypothetical protein [Pseudomonas baltica]|uniref:hypothetical protein n=1 Tax=Pseudomonas baltica TaxID=2762576 RepID=UPI00289C9320|nr:hypothetical protein [Pseudomonas baltica]